MSIKLFWCRGRGRADVTQQNFGDYLSPLLVEMLSRKPVVYAPVHKAQMMAIGSIMGREKKAKRFFIPRKLHIWGSGTDAASLEFSGRHYYHAVRGLKTKEQIVGLKGVPALGDPGLLSELWWQGRPVPEKRYKIGLIPHYVDQGLDVVASAGRMPGVKLINVFWPVDEVLKSIQECDFIISSSMHGLIVADSFGIPNRRIILSSGLISDYKFADYYSVFGMESPTPLLVGALLCLDKLDLTTVCEDYFRAGLSDIQDQLVKSFPVI